MNKIIRGIINLIKYQTNYKKNLIDDKVLDYKRGVNEVLNTKESSDPLFKLKKNAKYETHRIYWDRDFWPSEKEYRNHLKKQQKQNE